MRDDEMLNKTTPYKSGNVQGISDTVKLMDEFDMNALNDSIGPEQHGKTKPSKYSKNS